MVSKSGKIVSKRKSAAAKSRGEALEAWREALSEAADELGVPYTIPETGTPLYKVARRIYGLGGGEESDDTEESDDDGSESSDC